GEWFRPMATDAGDASADMVDHVVDMAFGQNRGSNYVFRCLEALILVFGVASWFEPQGEPRGVYHLIFLCFVLVVIIVFEVNVLVNSLDDGDRLFEVIVKLCWCLEALILVFGVASWFEPQGEPRGVYHLIFLCFVLVVIIVFEVNVLVNSLDDGDRLFEVNTLWKGGEWFRPMATDAGDASADMVDHVVDMAFGQNRGSNYVFRFEALEVYAIV
nr:patatin-like protein 6 [Tanacetum cinerariifolium]